MIQFNCNIPSHLTQILVLFVCPFWNTSGRCSLHGVLVLTDPRWLTCSLATQHVFPELLPTMHHGRFKLSSSPMHYWNLPEPSRIIWKPLPQCNIGTFQNHPGKFKLTTSFPQCTMGDSKWLPSGGQFVYLPKQNGCHLVDIL